MSDESPTASFQGTISAVKTEKDVEEIKFEGEITSLAWTADLETIS